MPDNDPIVITPIRTADDGKWVPQIGLETKAFLDRLPIADNAREDVRDMAKLILAQGACPIFEEDQQRTGLVTGYVQSGKTMSFETVIALACDNEFQVVIVIAGISKLLLEQSERRLYKDLNVSSGQWLIFSNPSDNDAQRIRNALENWSDPNTLPGYKKTILITVLKNYQHLEKLVSIFSNLDMQGIPVLIVDDEADQASLNTQVSQGDESSTYRHLTELKQNLPRHTYLQYTATPQAPLLISTIDWLSPNFVQVLNPGHDYVGGADFFNKNANRNAGYIREIPPADVPPAADQLADSDPPASLKEALRFFIIGVVAELLSGTSGVRSMLVHPSHLVAPHQIFSHWIRQIRDYWKHTLTNSAENDPDKIELLEEFHDAYRDLAHTMQHLCAFKELAKYLPAALRNTEVEEVNTRETGITPQINWDQAPHWVLVGGPAMARGFTVKGLTVTYMPRGIGGGNADALEQRARFFGYKRSYLGYCRIYLEKNTEDAFRAYIEHEEHMRRELLNWQGKPLSEWKRAFFLDSHLKPCRKQVVEFEYMRGNISAAWERVPRVISMPDDVVSNNRNVVSQFAEALNFEELPKHPNQTEYHNHIVCHGVLLRDAIEKLLVPFKVTSTIDSQHGIGLLLQLEEAVKNNPNETCSIYYFPKRRERTVSERTGEPLQFYQGAAPPKTKEQGGRVITPGEIYPGDRQIGKNDTHVAVQIHTLDLLDEQSSKFMENVPAIAVWVPKRLEAHWVVQNQQA